MNKCPLLDGAPQAVQNRMGAFPCMQQVLLTHSPAASGDITNPRKTMAAMLPARLTVVRAQPLTLPNERGQ